MPTPPYFKHLELPIYSALPAKIEAECFNLALRALTRRGPEAGPIWLEMPELRSLKLIITAEAWVVADGALHDMPVAAWTDFAPSPARALHEPVPCTLAYYHGMAGLIVTRTKDILRRDLAEMLGDGDGDGGVVAFPSD